MPDGFVFSQLPTCVALPPSGLQDEATLIRVCREFAEAELTCWYRYVTAPIAVADTLPWPTDWDALRWITATPAISLDGLQAKALALSAWNRDAFDDPADERDTHSPLLASLLRDLTRSARATIVTRLQEQHGPLPAGYTADGMWTGTGAGA